MDGATEEGSRAKEEPSGPDSAAIQVDPGVWVSPFDYSVDNFFASMDSISALCGATGEENFDGGELQRFSSMITFLKEWKQFHYEPKTIRFAHATESERVKDATGGISLSQFSSATVPKIEQLANEAKCSGSNDFILHAGGPVWALDWCPRIHEKAGCNDKREYLAVAAHPPGSTYHKIGMPLVGRGVIQIWCFLNLEEKVELPPAMHRMRGRPRKMPVKEEPAFDSKGKEVSVKPTARGGPRKRPLVIVDDPDGQKEVKPRGRPRKRLLPDYVAISETLEKVICAPHKVHINKNKLSATALSENWENVDSVTCQTDNGVTAELCERNIIPLATDPTTCVHSRSKEEEARAFSHLNNTNPRLSTTNEQNHKEMAVTRVSTHDSKDMDLKCSISKDTTLPRVVFCLAHNGKVAWDVKWRPYSVNNSEGKQHMGYLAVLLGNGSLEVWEVPVPGMVKILYSGRTEGTDPRFLKLEPVFRCSKVKCGDRQSIPLTVEWSPSSPCDLILAGCHDGLVALWKFTTEHSSQDSKPLLCFSADSVPIRALAWAPEDDTEGANVIVTAGHDGIKFWDVRDPYHPLWDYSPVQRFVLSLDWLKDPGCIILSLDDGTLRMISLLKAAHDLPVTGELFSGAKQPGLHTCPCSHFAIWNVQVSRATGIVAYCTAEGSVCRFQLTAKAVEKDASRYRMPHFLCGSLTKEGQVLEINTPPPDVPLQNIPLQIKKLPKEFGDSPRTLIDFSDRKISRLSNPSAPALCSGDDWTPKDMKTSSKSRKDSKANPTPPSDTVFSNGETDEGNLESTEHKQDGSKQDVVEFPSKLVAMHRVRWNMNKGSERWLCYGGAAGIIRCQEIPY